MPHLIIGTSSSKPSRRCESEPELPAIVCLKSGLDFQQCPGFAWGGTDPPPQGCPENNRGDPQKPPPSIVYKTKRYVASHDISLHYALRVKYRAANIALPVFKKCAQAYQQVKYQWLEYWKEWALWERDRLFWTMNGGGPFWSS